MITADLRQAICEAAGFRLDPGLRPGPDPGTYSSTAPFDVPDTDSFEAAREMARQLGTEPWVATAEATGAGYLTVTVTDAALMAVSARIVAAGPDCVRNDALAGTTVSAPRQADIAAAATWSQAHASLVAEVTARLRHASGATPAPHDPAVERSAPRDVAGRRASVSHRRPSKGVGDSPMPFVSGTGEARVEDGTRGAELASAPADSPAAAVEWAGEDAVRFALASIPPGHSVKIDANELARHVLTNPAFAVRYAHARAASVPRWQRPAHGATNGATDVADTGATDGATDGADIPATRGADPGAAGVTAGRAAASAAPPAASAGPPAEAAERELLGLLSWLPERVAIAARRGRPDEFARYLGELAAGSIAATGTASNLELAAAARVGLAAGLGLLGIAVPDRL